MLLHGRTAVAVAFMLAVAYLVGSIPASIIAARLLSGTDVRDQGSGNAGATNVARVLGWKVGLAVAAFDVAKGAAAVLLVSRIAPLAASPSAAAALCGLAAIVGHVLPVFAGFRGGKGVATAAGAAVAIAPVLALFGLVTFVSAAALSRRASVASLAGAAALPVAYLVSRVFGAAADPGKGGFCLAALLVILITHRGNIGRLLRGVEPPTTFGRRPPT
jgi:acyl phosphate:glycerol-3-phosphate acyltransferase